ncbi:hypothetical protein NUU61_006810 [Penicillium alfredii]|uniref:UBL3-like ubiquitin domain-containing protein n=1 Tax=Penicillium alfredii TaxID=1506179 RepID=A0A9W9F1N2_9EURO|nr:uncharacterized protein NUU61_006810 [Penicillium alfredii]KAJ5091940.1 hypothetical protein NUU61_006810 [Penicillium alfredii]
MSSTDQPASEAHSGPTTSPQESQPQPPSPQDAESVPANTDPVAAAPTAAPLDHPQPSDAAAANHPATSGESAPVTATTSTSPTPPNNTTSPVALPQDSDAPAMHTEEPKPAAEPSEDLSDVASGKEVEDPGPSLVITLLLTTGSRHPFTIDGKYLRKCSVNVENYDPFAMSVYTLKELIWREWRSDWETRPSSPSSIRLISFGKLLDDKSPLSDSRFNHDAPNVVHMTVKPQEVVDEEDAKGAKAQYSREREASERSPGCRCVIL